MANYTWRTRTTVCREYLVPRGDCVGELYKALTAAWDERRQLLGKDSDGRMPDDWAWIDFDDEHVIIRFEITEVNP